VNLNDLIKVNFIGTVWRGAPGELLFRQPADQHEQCYMALKTAEMEFLRTTASIM
jgi:hypothetical protein